MSYLKEEKVKIESLNETLTLRELNAAGQIALMEAKDTNFEGMFIACKHGVMEWAEKSVDEIKGMLTLRQAGEVSTAVFELSGVEVKNSESDPGDDSSSA